MVLVPLHQARHSASATQHAVLRLVRLDRDISRSYWRLIHCGHPVGPSLKWIGDVASRPEPTCDYRGYPTETAHRGFALVTDRSPAASPTARVVAPSLSPFRDAHGYQSVGEQSVRLSPAMTCQSVLSEPRRPRSRWGARCLIVPLAGYRSRFADRTTTSSRLSRLAGRGERSAQ